MMPPLSSHGLTWSINTQAEPTLKLVKHYLIKQDVLKNLLQKCAVADLDYLALDTFSHVTCQKQTGIGLVHWFGGGK
jgi:hypothetical protein